MRKIQVLALAFILVTAASGAAFAQSGSHGVAPMLADAAQDARMGGGAAPAAFAPRKWELGPFVNYGNGLIDRTDYHFFAAGFQAGRVISPMIHAGALSGRFEYGANVMPLFQAYTPAAHCEPTVVNGLLSSACTSGGTFTGASVTPVVFRWNFGNEHRRVLPWFQAQAGVLWTNHKFPPVLSPVTAPEGTSIWNFRSGAGVGMHYFTDPRHSIDFALNVEHISSASLGDKNPGVNASLQFQVGYTWWK